MSAYARFLGQKEETIIRLASDPFEQIAQITVGTTATQGDPLLETVSPDRVIPDLKFFSTLIFFV